MSREPRIASASLVLARQPTLCTMCTRKKFQFAICTSRLGIGSGKCVSSEGLSSASGMYRFCCTFWSGGRKGDPVIRDNEGRFLSMRESGKGSVLFHVVSHSTKLLSLTLSLVDFLGSSSPIALATLRAAPCNPSSKCPNSRALRAVGIVRRFLRAYVLKMPKLEGYKIVVCPIESLMVCAQGV